MQFLFRQLFGNISIAGYTRIVSNKVEKLGRTTCRGLGQRASEVEFSLWCFIEKERLTLKWSLIEVNNGSSLLFSALLQNRQWFIGFNTSAALWHYTIGPGASCMLGKCSTMTHIPSPRKNHFNIGWHIPSKD
jgi:hypothetical protein